jgi:ribosome-associated heat shock protein Hsp15
MMRARTDCADLVALGSIRINRQPTGKPHAKLRVGDVLTIPLHGAVRVLRVASLATRRGPSREARLLYVDVSDENVARRDAADDDASDVSATSCIAASSPAYRGV